MTGHSNSEPVLEQVLWPDATLEYMAADYDSVMLRIRESTGRVKVIHCEGYIGFGVLGFWDEVIVDHAEIATEHSAIERAVNSISKRLGQGWIDSGNELRNTRHWLALIVHLSDGCCLEIVAAKITID